MKTFNLILVIISLLIADTLAIPLQPNGMKYNNILEIDMF